MLRVVDYTRRTDTGRQRQSNEDSLFARPPLFAVADGMGGARAGEVASRIAAEAFEPGLPDGGEAQHGLAERAREANARINALAGSDDAHAGMGTTLTAAYVGENDVAIAHVGDSRAYRLRDGELERLTRDHSLVYELYERGKITEEEMETHPQRSVITRALGPEPQVQVDASSHPARAGDVYLLCSDGLTSMVSEPRIHELWLGAASLDEAGRALIDEANANGGRDNITVILFRLEAVGAGADPSLEQPTQVSPGAGRVVREAAAAAGAGGAAAMSERAGAEAAPATQAPPPRTAPRPARAPRAGSGRRPRRDARAGRRLLRLGPTVVVLAVIAAIVVGAWVVSRSVYFVGTDRQGFITVYRGLPYELPAGLDLYQSSYTSAVPASELPPARRAKVLDHTLRSRGDASDLVRQIERRSLR